MKKLMTLSLLAASLVVAGPALASEELSKANGCTTCHDATKKKMGPSVKDISAKFKGNAGAADTIVANLKAGKGHPASKASDADLKAIVAWMLK
jgi:cytochrome c